jgi:endonuclease YncB( thermonuclease family)
VNVEMVRAGMAYHYAKYSGNWAGEYEKPWAYRNWKIRQ